MTRRDLMLHTLLKVTGQPRPHLERVLDRFEERGANLRQALSPAEQTDLERSFAEEASGILAWYADVLRQNEDLMQDRAETIQRENAKKNRKFRKR